MKIKPARHLSSLQKIRLTKIVVLLVTIALAWLIFAPDSGLWALLRQHSRLTELERKTFPAGAGQPRTGERDQTV
jgi:hypothetical protein